MSKKKYTTVNVKDFQTFINKIEQRQCLNNQYPILFRGQKNTDWNLEPKISRNKKSDKSEFKKRENTIFTNFKKRAIAFLPNDIKSNIDNDWEWLALAQHYGLATRLLDWAENPLVALFFAFLEPSDKPIKRAVWMFKIEEGDMVDTSEDPLSIKKTRMFQPNYTDKRIIAQSAWFSVHYFSATYKRCSLFNNLKIMNGQKDRLIKFEIENKREEILNWLDKLGINQNSIFPDLSGLCEYLNWKHCENAGNIITTPRVPPLF